MSLVPQQTELALSQTEFARAVQEIDTQSGIVPDPTMTHEKLRVMVLAGMQRQGLSPSDNIGTRDLLRMRYGEDWEQD